MGIENSPQLLNAIRGAFESFGWDRLSFLSLTGKSELMMRDVLAVHLHQSLGDRYHVAREWSSSRHDLVVFEGGVPSTIVETKFWTAFDSLDSKKRLSRNPKHGLLGALEVDVRKIKETRSGVGVPGRDFGATFIYAADPSAMHSPPKGVVKYESHLAKGSAGRALDALLDDAVAAFAEASKEIGVVASGCIGHGKCWGSEVFFGAVIVEVT